MNWRDWFPARAWERKFRREGWELESVEAREVFTRRDGGVLFAMLEARGRDPEGKPMLPYVLLRGMASVIVPVAVNRATGEKRFIMIWQRRVGSGDMSLEFPAGMVDGEEDAVAAAARELEEETGLHVNPSDLTSLWDGDLYSSPGLSDENVRFYGIEIALDDAAYRALEGGSAGHADEGEHIVTTLKTFAEASREITSLLPLLGFFLYRRRFGDIA